MYIEYGLYLKFYWN